MCRITGVIDKNSKQISQNTVCMRDAMKHGGPDHAGFYFDQDRSFALGHRRLSIIDLCESGNQPMFSEDGEIALIFNGEIYNYKELKEELIKQGYQFNTHSDTEVIIKAYQRWSTQCFEKFRGMFAIALLDKKRNELILARDHAGIKPLYYYCDGNSLYFASEIRAFRKLRNKWEENPDWRVYFLTYGYLPQSVTTLKGVKPLEKGSYCIFNIRTLHSKQYFFFEDIYTEEIKDLNEARELVQQILCNAVNRHLIADAPLGLFLSGGIDSSLLTLLAKQYKNEDLHTLSIIFDDKGYSEKKYQDIIAKKVQSKHQSFLLSKEMFLNALPDILEAMDQPSADGINSYFISKFAKEAGLKAVLSGLGADELFGGYPSFNRIDLLKKLKWIPRLFLHAADRLSQDKYRKINFLQYKNSLGDYLFNRGYFTPRETARLLDMEMQEVKSILSNVYIPAFVDNLSDGNKVSYLESNLYMESQLLKDTDVMSMWHSIEVRVPFLDYDIIKMIHKVDSSLKYNKKQGKFLLIDSFRELLPREIWNRKKQGFVFPFDIWMRDSIEQYMPVEQNKDLNEQFKAGKLNWNRYWTYLICQKFKA
ncbi:MAG: asparagine synthase (glutamine-hydrolyzing) [Flavisolibacter sp.]|nr:asparagine synthase (glutamine-hydrolyzing) [Flavisolibacter sp.]